MSQKTSSSSSSGNTSSRTSTTGSNNFGTPLLHSPISCPNNFSEYLLAINSQIFERNLEHENLQQHLTNVKCKIRAAESRLPPLFTEKAKLSQKLANEQDELEKLRQKLAKISPNSTKLVSNPGTNPFLDVTSLKSTDSSIPDIFKVCLDEMPASAPGFEDNFAPKIIRNTSSPDPPETVPSIFTF